MCGVKKSTNVQRNSNPSGRCDHAVLSAQGKQDVPHVDEVLEGPAERKDEQGLDGTGFEAQGQDVCGVRGEGEAEGQAEAEEEKSHEEKSRAPEKSSGPEKGEEEITQKTFYYRCYRRGFASAFSCDFAGRRFSLIPPGPCGINLRKGL